MTSPLSGLRVLDFTRFVSGSYATMLLAHLGADVVKIEAADGDPYRLQGTKRVKDESVLFLSLNTGKRSVGIDFRHKDGGEIVERLLASSDFLMENARPGSLRPYGLDYEAVHHRHPAIVYGSISGYGDVGPDAEKGGFDLVLQAESGIMSVTGTKECGPVKVGAPLLDIGAGISCVMGLLAAHIERLATGVGSHVSASLFEFALAGLSGVAADYFAAGAVPGLLGTHSPTFAPYGNFRTRDGWLVLAGAGSDDLWRRACSVLGAESLLADLRFADNASRVAHREELTAEIEKALSRDTTSGWLDRLEAAGVPATEVKDLGQVLESEQVAALGMVQELEHPSAGSYRVLGTPMRFDPPVTVSADAAPRLGADTKAVLLEVGYGPAEIDKLAELGVVHLGREGEAADE